MKHVYMAHPLGQGPERDTNIRNALRWLAWITESFYVAASANWIALALAFTETAESRARGLAIDLVHVSRCDELWLVGGRVTQGMSMEYETAKANGLRVHDLTSLGYDPPARDSLEDPEFKRRVYRLLSEAA